MHRKGMLFLDSCVLIMKECWNAFQSAEALMLPGLGFHSWKIVYAIASAQYSWGSKRETIVVKGSKWKHRRKILKCYPPVFSDDEHLTFETTGSPCFPSEFYLRRSVLKKIHPCSFCVFIWGLGQFPTTVGTSPTIWDPQYQAPTYDI